MELRVLVLARWKELRVQGLLRLKGQAPESGRQDRLVFGHSAVCAGEPEEGPGSLSSN